VQVEASNTCTHLMTGSVALSYWWRGLPDLEAHRVRMRPLTVILNPNLNPNPLTKHFGAGTPHCCWAQSSPMVQVLQPSVSGSRLQRSAGGASCGALCCRKWRP